MIITQLSAERVKLNTSEHVIPMVLSSSLKGDFFVDFGQGKVK